MFIRELQVSEDSPESIKIEIKSLNQLIALYNQMDKKGKATPLEKILCLDIINLKITQLDERVAPFITETIDAVNRELRYAQSFNSLFVRTMSKNSLSNIEKASSASYLYSQERKIESLLKRISITENIKEKITLLKELQEQTLSAIRKYNLQHEKPLTYRSMRNDAQFIRLLTLLETANNELTKLQPERQLILSQMKEQSSIREFGDRLISTEKDPTFFLNRMKLECLHRGNNIIWKVSDTDADSTFQCILRIEKGSYTNHQLRLELIHHPKLKEHIADETFYCSMMVVGNKNALPDEALKANHPPPDRLVNLAVSEYCERKNIGYAVQKETQLSATKHHASLSVTEQVAGIANDFLTQGFVYSDIKAENFLIRNDGKVVVSDLKSIKKLDSDKGMDLSALALTPGLTPPELKIVQGKEKISAEAYMSFQIGLMLYMLISGLTEGPNISDDVAEEKEKVLKQLANYGPDELSFDAWGFQSPQGNASKALIVQCLSPNPKERPKLKEIISHCNKVRETLTSRETYIEEGSNRFMPKEPLPKARSDSFLSKLMGKKEEKLFPSSSRSSPSSSSSSIASSSSSAPLSNSSSEQASKMKEALQDMRKKDSDEYDSPLGMDKK